MADKVFALITDTDREQAMAVGLIYPLSCARNKWLEEVKFVFFGPSEKLAAFKKQVQEKVKEIKELGVEVLACK
jgi:hypothetical protein